MPIKVKVKKTERKLSVRKRAKKNSAQEQLLHHLERKYTANFEPFPEAEFLSRKKKIKSKTKSIKS